MAGLFDTLFISRLTGVTSGGVYGTDADSDASTLAQNTVKFSTKVALKDIVSLHHFSTV